MDVRRVMMRAVKIARSEVKRIKRVTDGMKKRLYTLCEIESKYYFGTTWRGQWVSPREGCAA